jgi:hypothetical protein
LGFCPGQFDSEPVAYYLEAPEQTILFNRAMPGF